MLAVEKIQIEIDTLVKESKLNNAEIVQIIEQLGGYLNLATIPKYATSEGITYPGVLNRIKLNKVQQVDIFGVKMIIENK